MNEKLNIQNLIDILAERHGMSKRNADSFVKEFFRVIEESLERDKYVKVKGLGTFKLIEVGSRESVNVNTGERFEIQGHKKVSFTPETAMKDAINKPFSHFETVILNDDVVLEDTPLDTGNEDDEESVAIESAEQTVVAEEIKDIAEETPVIVEEQTVVVTSEEVDIIAPEEITVTPVVPEEADIVPEDTDITPEDSITTPIISEEVVTPPEETVETKQEEKPAETISEHVVPAEPAQPEPVIKDTADASTMKYFIGIVVLVMILCGGAVAFMYYPNLHDRSEKPAVEKEKETDVNNSVSEQTAIWTDDAEKDGESVQGDTTAVTAVNPMSQDTDIPVSSAPSATQTKVASKQTENVPQEQVKVAANEQITTAPKEQKKSTPTPFKADSVGYEIVGTEATYTIKEGETLTRVALRFYGTKALWPYLVKHNPTIIKNPDNVPYGTTIKIPKLVKKQ